MKRCLRAGLICLAIILSAGCFAAPAASGTGEERVIVCSFYPIRIFAENVLQGVPDVRLETLAPAGTGCLHDFQLQTGDMRRLDGALCLIINGAGMEQSFLPLVTRERPALQVADCSRGIEIMTDNGEDNPHIWLSPALAAQMTRNMGESLALLLPENAERILENAETYAQALDSLGEEMRQALAPARGRAIVTFHEAFPYFARDLGLTVLACVTEEPDETPSPRMIARTVELVLAQGGCPLFAEPNVRMDALDVIARETGCPVYELDPVTDGETAADAYQTRMRQNLRVLLEAFGLAADGEQ